MLNTVIIMGRLTADPELKQTGKGDTSCAFTLAVPRLKKTDPADFINCVAFNRQAEILSAFARKGSALIISGRLRHEIYTTNAGETRSLIKIVAHNISFPMTNKEDVLESESAPSSPEITSDFEKMLIDEDPPF